MKVAALCLNIALGLAGSETLAQDAAMERLRACTVLPPPDRADCLDRAARDMTEASPRGAPPAMQERSGAADAAPPAEPGARWLFSETTSPIDYSPVAIASASSPAQPGGGTVQLSFGCRAGKSEMVVRGPSAAATLDGATVSFALPDRPPTAVQVVAAGNGLAARTDVGRLLASLPGRGSLGIMVMTREGATQQAHFDLAALKGAVDRLARPCRWPAADASSRH